MRDVSDPIDIVAAPEQWAHYLRPTDDMICVTAPHITPRLRAQSGTFTLHGANIHPLDWYTVTRPHITKIFIPIPSPDKSWKAFVVRVSPGALSIQASIASRPI